VNTKYEYLDDLEKLEEDGQIDQISPLPCNSDLRKPESNLALLNPKRAPTFPYAYDCVCAMGSKRHMILGHLRVKDLLSLHF
jgi:hypothetical protein